MMAINEILSKYGLRLKRGYDMDTITAKNREMADEVYNALRDVDGYCCIDKMGAMIILRK